MKKFEMNKTGLVIFAALLVLGLYDLYCIVFNGISSTISNYLTNVGFTSPIFNFVIGAICGHALFPMQPKKDGNEKTN